MTHLGFITAAYALAVLVPTVFAISTIRRLGVARRKLSAVDPRAKGRA